MHTLYSPQPRPEKRVVPSSSRTEGRATRRLGFSYFVSSAFSDRINPISYFGCSPFADALAVICFGEQGRS